MLALRNNNKLAGNNGKPLVNAEITSLQVVNTNGFQFRIVSTGPIRVYCGDGNYIDISAKSTLYTVNIGYSVTGTYNIIITNQWHITTLLFDHATYPTKINTNISWLSQFYNLENINLTNATFTGNLDVVINAYLKKLTSITYSYNNNTFKTNSFNISNCINFWNTCTYCSVYGDNCVTGVLDNINFPTNATYIYIQSSTLSGNINNILKNGYTVLQTLKLLLGNNITWTLGNIENIIVPESMTLLWLQVASPSLNIGKFDNFNFNALRTFFLVNITGTTANWSNNTTFETMISRNNYITLAWYGNVGLIDITINCSKFTGTYASCFIGTVNSHLYGDCSNIYNKVLYNPYITNSLERVNDTYGTMTFETAANGILIGGANLGITLTADTLKSKSNIIGGLVLTNFPNFSGDISNIVFNNITASYGIVIRNMSSNLYCDITTINFGSNFYNNIYQQIIFLGNPNFYGDLGLLSLWKNKLNITFSYCRFTNIPGFINNLFTQRNTCLKASGGVTTINIAGNVDNASLTGTYQRGSLGTFTGNQNDLTEAQIDNLAAGLDYTGSGSSTAWSHKEKIWWLVNCKNSSTDSSSRYRVNITY